CFQEEHGHCTITRICRLRGVLGEALKAFYAVLDDYTLADLVQNRSALARVMFHPAASRAAS
ncbi:MAG: BadM/Rrf2 family transcriptional regulator, partial [Polaromonas sp.]